MDGQQISMNINNPSTTKYSELVPDRHYDVYAKRLITEAEMLAVPFEIQRSLYKPCNSYIFSLQKDILPRKLILTEMLTIEKLGNLSFVEVSVNCKWTLKISPTEEPIAGESKFFQFSSAYTLEVGRMYCHSARHHLQSAIQDFKWFEKLFCSFCKLCENLVKLNFKIVNTRTLELSYFLINTVNELLNSPKSVPVAIMVVSLRIPQSLGKIHKFEVSVSQLIWQVANGEMGQSLRKTCSRIFLSNAEKKVKLQEINNFIEPLKVFIKQANEQYWMRWLWNPAVNCLYKDNNCLYKDNNGLSSLKVKFKERLVYSADLFFSCCDCAKIRSNVHSYSTKAVLSHSRFSCNRDITIDVILWINNLNSCLKLFHFSKLSQLVPVEILVPILPIAIKYEPLVHLSWIPRTITHAALKKGESSCHVCLLFTRFLPGTQMVQLEVQGNEISVVPAANQGATKRSLIVVIQISFEADGVNRARQKPVQGTEFVPIVVKIHLFCPSDLSEQTWLCRTVQQKFSRPIGVSDWISEIFFQNSITPKSWAGYSPVNSLRVERSYAESKIDGSEESAVNQMMIHGSSFLDSCENVPEPKFKEPPLKVVKVCPNPVAEAPDFSEQKRSVQLEGFEQQFDSGKSESTVKKDANLKSNLMRCTVVNKDGKSSRIAISIVDKRGIAGRSSLSNSDANVHPSTREPKVEIKDSGLRAEEFLDTNMSDDPMGNKIPPAIKIEI